MKARNLAPFFAQKICLQVIFMTVPLLLGFGLLQGQAADSVSAGQLLLGAVPVVIAAFAYPLGSHKLMPLAKRLDAYQWELGMTLASLPLCHTWPGCPERALGRSLTGTRIFLLQLSAFGLYLKMDPTTASS
ncbi:multidrug resistance efflux transporter family protein [Effusibacillus pohliae]|uniref:multidrug resistance efflux transporter family protein n=1 Tax=Effusibacillus pohliae TaxID=232270 RepID=UPI00036685ED|nr:multidrug resistance efflux transporter family protein [Effusibacillus pohliae]